MTESLTLKEEAERLAKQLFEDDIEKRAGFTSGLLDIYSQAKDKDFLVIHNPGGWGTTRVENLLQWERSIVEGVSASIEKLGYNRQLIQYFRTDRGIWEIMKDIREQMRFFTNKARIMAAEIEFITR
ncbi:unnamed protein product, partial [marine sediment metagenome]